MYSPYNEFDSWQKICFTAPFLLQSITRLQQLKHCNYNFRMEKYQYQLEELVEERTAELKDEKRRTENLLQRMLPM